MSLWEERLGTGCPGSVGSPAMEVFQNHEDVALGDGHSGGLG